MPGPVTDTNHIDRIIDQVLARFDHPPGDSQDDIYVWSDGRITGPPTGNEGDNTRLLTVVTPGGIRPSREELRVTMESGLDVVTIPEEVSAGPVAARVTANPHYNNAGASPPTRG